MVMDTVMGTATAMVMGTVTVTAMVMGTVTSIVEQAPRSSGARCLPGRTSRAAITHRRGVAIGDTRMRRKHHPALPGAAPRKLRPRVPPAEARTAALRQARGQSPIDDTLHLARQLPENVPRSARTICSAATRSGMPASITRLCSSVLCVWRDMLQLCNECGEKRLQ